MKIQYVVVNRDDDEENSFDDIRNARHFLLSLVTLGITAYMLTVPLYKI